MINHLSRTLNPDAPAHELHMRILEVLAKNEDETPTEVALKIIHDEATRVMTYGTY